MVQMPEELVSRLDQRASRQRVSRSELIRQAVIAYLQDEEEEAIARAYETGYTKVPFGTPDEWGDVDRFHEALARERNRGQQDEAV